MNGLRYIRIRCNLSVNELAEHLDLTRQAISSWENERKEIPEKRLKQLEDFFGLDKKYFREISDEDVEFIQNKAMFRYDEKGKETYRYKPRSEVTNLYAEEIVFMGDRNQSIDEEYALAQKHLQQTLNRIEDIIRWTDNAGSIESQTMLIRSGCGIFNMIIDLMEHCHKQKKSTLKMPLLYEYKNVWKAMMIAYGLMGTEELDYIDLSRYFSGEDGEWIIELSHILRKRWEETLKRHDSHFEKIKNNVHEHKKIKESFDNKSIAEQIEMVEKQVKESRKVFGESVTLKSRK